MKFYPVCPRYDASSDGNGVIRGCQDWNVLTDRGETITYRAGHHGLHFPEYTNLRGRERWFCAEHRTNPTKIYARWGFAYNKYQVTWNRTWERYLHNPDTDGRCKVHLEHHYYANRVHYCHRPRRPTPRILSAVWSAA